MDVATFVEQARKGLVDLQPGEWEATVAAGMSLVDEHPDAVYDIAVALMNASVQGGYVLQELLPFMPEEHWIILAPLALTALEHDANNTTAISVLEKAVFQAPTSLHLYLDRLLIAGTEAIFSFEYAFHESTVEDVRFLLDDGYGDYDRLDVDRGLLATQLPEVMRQVQARCSNVEHFADALADVGYEVDGDAYQQLYPDRVLHLAFPLDDPDALPTAVPGMPAGFRSASHPTWTLPELGAPRYRFGGRGATTCDRCGDVIDHLLTLSPIPDGLGIRGLTQLEIAVCLSCWAEEGEESYQHDVQGRPHDLPHRDPAHDHKWRQVESLPETTVGLAALGPRWRWQAWDHSENLNRLGGLPFWVQYPEYQPCPLCDRSMHFLLQLNLDEITSDGLGYVLWCNLCKVSHFRQQQT